MVSPMNIVKRLADKCYKLATNPSDMFLVTGTLGWVLSALAQVTAVVINKKIPEEQKKFLIPQEIADAGVNIASFILFTRYTSKIADKLVSSGKLATPKIRKFLEENKLTSSIGKNIKEIIKGEEKINSFNVEAEILNPKNKTENGLKEHYYAFADSVSFISSTIGSIISCNIITPLLRNKIASSRQKASLEKDKQQQESFQPYAPVLPAQNKLGPDNYRTKLGTITSSGSIRI